jgi:DNA mismatch repair ATPase MutS
MEALSALAGLAFDNPDWVRPEILEGDDCIRAEGLGHPLIPRPRRVVNDVVVGPPGDLLLVTGSNMSGKSTLLRSIGVNLALAYAGGPVCATRFSAPPVRLYTSMRIHDSLEAGVSHFMAALRRLKRIIDAARQGRVEDGRLCYLIDDPAGHQQRGAADRGARCISPAPGARRDRGGHDARSGDDRR